MTIWRVARGKPEVDFKEETGEKRRAQGGDLRTFLGDFAAALPQSEFAEGSSL
jgi:hypothetical protein